MKIITIANQKGGVGKTTTALCLAALLNKAGHKTLLIDADSQCNSTDTYRAVTENTATLYDLVVDNEQCNVYETIQHAEFGDIIAGDTLLAEADATLTGEGAFLKLREALKDLTGYEYVVIDTNPTLNTMLCNALVASDEVIIPVNPARYTIKGLSDLTNTIVSIQNELNHSLKVRGLLLVDIERRANIDKQVEKQLPEIAETIGTTSFKTGVRHTAKVREAQSARMPLVLYAPRSTAAEDYKAFVEEYLKGEK